MTDPVTAPVEQPTITELANPHELPGGLAALFDAKTDLVECALGGEPIGWFTGDYTHPGGWVSCWALQAPGDSQPTLLCEDCLGWLGQFGLGVSDAN